MSAPIGLQIVFGFLLFALIFVPLERQFPQRHQPVFRAGWITDAAYYVAGCFLGKFSDAASSSTVVLIGHGLGLNAGAMAASQPGWIQFFEIVMIADFLSYWFHRGLHTFPWLWRFHRVHHSSQQLDWFANVRLHPVDKLLGDLSQFVPILLLGFGEAPMLAYTIFLGFQTFLTHSNIRLNFGPLRWVIAGPQFHHWHHCNDPKAYNKNFSPYLVIFDVLFGTAHFPQGRSLPETYGLSEAVPATFWAQMIHPFHSPPPAAGRARSDTRS